MFNWISKPKNTKKPGDETDVCWKVFFDIAIDNEDAGRLEMDLFCQSPRSA